MVTAGVSCVSLLEGVVGKGAGEEAISRALRDAHGLLKGCQPAERASACLRVGDWLSSRAMVTLGEYPCWEPVPLPLLSLIFYLISQSLTFYLRAKAEAARVNMRWQCSKDPELSIERLLSWALQESGSLGMPTLLVGVLRCICDCFARTPNARRYKSQSGAEAHLMLSDLIFRQQADGPQTEVLQRELSLDIGCGAGSSNVECVDSDMPLSVCVDAAYRYGSSDTRCIDARRAWSVDVTSGVAEVDGSPKSEGINASSQNRNMKRVLELEECLHILKVAKDLVPVDARLLKLKVFLFCARIQLTTSSLCLTRYIHPKIKLPFVSDYSGGQNKEASKVSSSMPQNHIVPCVEGKRWLYLAHIGMTVVLLLDITNRDMR